MYFPILHFFKSDGGAHKIIDKTFFSFSIRNKNYGGWILAKLLEPPELRNLLYAYCTSRSEEAHSQLAAYLKKCDYFTLYDVLVEVENFDSVRDSGYENADLGREIMNLLVDLQQKMLEEGNWLQLFEKAKKNGWSPIPPFWPFSAIPTDEEHKESLRIEIEREERREKKASRWMDNLFPINVLMVMQKALKIFFNKSVVNLSFKAKSGFYTGCACGTVCSLILLISSFKLAIYSQFSSVIINAGFGGPSSRNCNSKDRVKRFFAFGG
ncbi:MAG TPA: hypothetical protein DCY12_06370, partial [Candidatus Atribacteria bacterium]|nr:hypothetical protein [Candidatus Atribacteria bacterium]